MPRPYPWPAQGDTNGWDVGLKGNVDYAITTADQALSTANANATGGIPGAVALDSFAGATDDAKLTAAMSYAAAQTRRPSILFPGRDLTFTQTRQTYSGMRLIGPGVGWQNPEQGGQNTNHRVTLNVGTGVNSWLVGNNATSATTTYDTVVKGFTFMSSNGNSQFYHHPYGTGGTCYAGMFEDLTFYGFRYAMGVPGDAMSMTLCTMRGAFTNVAVLGEQYSFRGSDNWLVPDSMNYGWAGANSGKYLVRFENMMKTTVRNFYLTARGGSRAILVQGPTNTQGGLDISDCVIEGQNANDPAMGALIRVEGGGVSFTNIRLNFGMFRPSDFTDKTDTAYIQCDGGWTVADTIWVNRASGVAETVPVLETKNSAKAFVSKFLPMNGTAGVTPWAGLPRVKQTAGSITLDSSVTLI
jgi:hypothetical protein